MKKIFLLFLATGLFFSSCNRKVAYETADGMAMTIEEGVFFMDSKKLGPILERAEEFDKLVFVDFYTTWCMPCRMMDEDVFPNKEIGDFMNENFINYKVNAEKGNGVNLKTLYNVNVYPTLIFLDSKGRELVRHEGAAYFTKLRELGNEALAAAKALEAEEAANMQEEDEGSNY